MSSFLLKNWTITIGSIDSRRARAADCCGALPLPVAALVVVVGGCEATVLLVLALVLLPPMMMMSPIASVEDQDQHLVCRVEALRRARALVAVAIRMISCERSRRPDRGTAEL
jgi:hypothetical protein